MKTLSAVAVASILALSACANNSSSPPPIAPPSGPNFSNPQTPAGQGSLRGSGEGGSGGQTGNSSSTR
jgi:ABC-type oligopeptide transport system substrate-binding subunit